MRLVIYGLEHSEMEIDVPAVPRVGDEVWLTEEDLDHLGWLPDAELVVTQVIWDRLPDRNKKNTWGAALRVKPR